MAWLWVARPAPLLANGWLSKFDKTIKGDAKLCQRYMDDILREIDENKAEDKLYEINNLYPSLSFTLKRENVTSIPFLDMLLTRNKNKVTSEWFTKPTDTGLTMNYHSLALQRYKRTVVIGRVYRIHQSCSTWTNFHRSLEKGNILLERN